MTANGTGTIWVMRAGKVGEDRFPEWENFGVCAIGFRPVTGRLHAGITDAGLEARVAECYPGKTEAAVKRPVDPHGDYQNGFAQAVGLASARRTPAKATSSKSATTTATQSCTPRSC